MSEQPAGSPLGHAQQVAPLRAGDHRAESAPVAHSSGGRDSGGHGLVTLKMIHGAIYDDGGGKPA
eukprot:scaffold3167_cov105-Isochrysis_galbana.AAC.8